MNEEKRGPGGSFSASESSGGSSPGRQFSRVKPVIVALLVVLVFAVLVFLALRPRQQREREVMEALEQTQGVPVVLVSKAKAASARSELLLPGTVQAMVETPIFARSEGYLRRRLADIGDRVTGGQLLAVVEAPEVDRQVQQAQAGLSRSEAAHSQATAALRQSDTQLKLAEVTAQRWNTLFTRRVVSRQEADEKQAAYDARRADNEAARANVSAAQEAVASSRAELQRLQELKGFQEIRAPFAGVVTARNTDVGALIRVGASEGRELFRLAQIDTVRIMVQVPQTNIPAIHIGDPAGVSVQERPGRQFGGTIARTANALDPASRTLLIEIRTPNPDGVLLPGMYAQVRFSNPQAASAIVISGDTLVIRPSGPQVAVVGEGGKIHIQKVVLGRDYGAETEVVDGLVGGESLVTNPGDDIQEGVVVRIQAPKEPSAPARPAK